MYFNEETLNLQFMELDNQPYILSIPNGLEPKEFADSNFTIPECSEYVDKEYKQH